MESTVKFEQRADRFAQQARDLDKQFTRISNLRLAVFLLGGAATILAFYYYSNLSGSLALLLTLGLFIALLLKHQQVVEQREHYQTLAQINQQCVIRLSGEGWDQFTEQGNDFSDSRHPYSEDLNLFGRASLFQWMNTAHSWHGQHDLANLLAAPDYDLKSIRLRQEAVQELENELEFCQQLEALGLQSSQLATDPEKLFGICENNKQTWLNAIWLRCMIFILSLFTLSVWIAYAFYQSTELLYGGCALLLLHFLINLLVFNSINTRLSIIGEFRERIRHYQRFFRHLENHEFKSTLLQELQQQFSPHQPSASTAIRRLDSLAGLIEMRSNPIVHFVINIGLFWDYHCFCSLERWLHRNGSQVRRWVETLGHYEALGSLALLPQLHPHWVWPQISESEVQLEATGLGHPLLPSTRCVINDVEMNAKILVITGSNMAGKTTLLRTVGSNLVLAYAGAPVCAEKLHCSVMKMHTSMRIQDDLHSGVSTFYAELLRIRQILEDARQQQPLLFLIDEIFRGTNSEDRALGAKSVVLNLNQPWVIGMIATHDLEICKLAESSTRIYNYHFAEHYENGEIKFDYRLQPNRSQTRNARFLMKMVGIEMADE